MPFYRECSDQHGVFVEQNKLVDNGKTDKVLYKKQICET